MACPFGDWQIFQDWSLNWFASFFFKLFNRFVELVAKSWIDTFLAIRLHYVYYNVLFCSKAMSTRFTRQENTNTVAGCAHAHTFTCIHGYEMLCINVPKCCTVLSCSYLHTHWIHMNERWRACIRMDPRHTANYDETFLYRIKMGTFCLHMCSLVLFARKFYSSVKRWNVNSARQCVALNPPSKRKILPRLGCTHVEWTLSDIDTEYEYWWSCFYSEG